jgi:hypothetical protein
MNFIRKVDKFCRWILDGLPLENNRTFGASARSVKYIGSLGDNYPWITSLPKKLFYLLPMMYISVDLLYLEPDFKG